MVMMNSLSLLLLMVVGSSRCYPGIGGRMCSGRTGFLLDPDDSTGAHALLVVVVVLLSVEEVGIGDGV